MRDNHDGYPEILNLCERDGHYFGVVRIVHPSESATFEFGVSAAGYFALRRVLNTRPFDSMPGVLYRYFFRNAFLAATQPEQAMLPFDVRIEQGDSVRTLRFEGPTYLLANLLWFQELKSFEPAAHLKRLG